MNVKNIKQQIQILLNQLNAKNYDHVISKAKILIKKYPQYVILYNLIGSSYQNKGDFLNAKKSFETGLKYDPNNLALMNNLAMTYKFTLEYELAENLFKRIIDTNDKYINAYVNLGNLKRDLNRFDEAINLYKNALKINSQQAIIYYSLALAEQGIGNFGKTISYAQKALEVDPNFTRADHLISQSKKYENKKDDHYLSLKKKITTFKEKSLEKTDIYFSLAKAEEDLGDIKESSQYLIKGNSLKKEIINYKLLSEIDLLDKIKEIFTKSNIKETSEKENMIFILGMPRSGTSLVEQIITSHSKVFGGGELPILSNIIKNNFIKDSELQEKDINNFMEDKLEINKLKNEYLKFIKNFKFSEPYITDKAPLNFRWIGFIKILFPGAKIINCVRDPKNNCLSMFKNLFEGGLNFTYDQEDLVKYYKYYEELMSFWKLRYKNSILDVHYENLIKNNNEEIKAIIKFCDLNWDEKCLSFFKNKTPIKTMSTAQARKPIYKSSLNAFEKYKGYLEILEKKL